VCCALSKAEKAKRQIEEIITHLHLATLMSEKMMSEKERNVFADLITQQWWNFPTSQQ
jgi:hypothetical protein